MKSKENHEIMANQDPQRIYKLNAKICLFFRIFGSQDMSGNGKISGLSGLFIPLSGTQILQLQYAGVQSHKLASGVGFGIVTTFGPITLSYCSH